MILVPKSYFKKIVETVRDPVTGYKNAEKLALDYFFHWKYYSNNHDLLVTKVDTSKDCVADFNGVTLISAVKILGIVHVVLHPSSHGYTMAKRTSAIVNQTVIFKDEVQAP